MAFPWARLHHLWLPTSIWDSSKKRHCQRSVSPSQKFGAVMLTTCSLLWRRSTCKTYSITWTGNTLDSVHGRDQTRGKASLLGRPSWPRWDRCRQAVDQSLPQADTCSSCPTTLTMLSREFRTSQGRRRGRESHGAETEQLSAQDDYPGTKKSAKVEEGASRGRDSE